jgi:hypothetical protein
MMSSSEDFDKWYEENKMETMLDMSKVTEAGAKMLMQVQAKEAWKAALPQQDAVYQRRYIGGVTGWVDISKHHYEEKFLRDCEYRVLYTAPPSTAQGVQFADYEYLQRERDEALLERDILRVKLMRVREALGGDYDNKNPR